MTARCRTPIHSSRSPVEPRPCGRSSTVEVVELPYTAPQDHTLFNLLGHTDASLWREQLERIVSCNGLFQVAHAPRRGISRPPDDRRRRTETCSRRSRGATICGLRSRGTSPIGGDAGHRGSPRATMAWRGGRDRASSSLRAMLTSTTSSGRVDEHKQSGGAGRGDGAREQPVSAGRARAHGGGDADRSRACRSKCWLPASPIARLVR